MLKKRIVRNAVFGIFLLGSMTVFAAPSYFSVSFQQCKLTESFMAKYDCQYFGPTPCSNLNNPTPAREWDPEDPDTWIQYCSQDKVDFERCVSNPVFTCQQCEDDEGGDHYSVCPIALCAQARCFDTYAECIGEINLLCRVNNYCLKCTGSGGPTE